jgi:hypothetical protein
LHPTIAEYGFACLLLNATPLLSNARTLTKTFMTTDLSTNQTIQHLSANTRAACTTESGGRRRQFQIAR